MFSIYIIGLLSNENIVSFVACINFGHNSDNDLEEKNN
jgi:hypothetical protein